MDYFLGFALGCAFTAWVIFGLFHVSKKYQSSWACDQRGCRFRLYTDADELTEFMAMIEDHIAGHERGLY